MQGISQEKGRGKAHSKYGSGTPTSSCRVDKLKRIEHRGFEVRGIEYIEL